MYYRDIQETHPLASPMLVVYNFGCSVRVANEIIKECHRFYNLGAESKEPDLVIYQPMWDTRQLNKRGTFRCYAKNNPKFDIDENEEDALGDLFFDAWVEGLGKRDRLIVKITHAETECPNCGDYEYKTELNEQDQHDQRVCSKCNHRFYGFVEFEVNGYRADLWADMQGALDGGTWETCDGNDMVYDFGMDRPSLIKDLEEEGYQLDTSEY